MFILHPCAIIFFVVQALSAAAAMVESKLSTELKSFIKKNIVKKELTDELGVADKVSRSP